jgi:hypothetical protein
VRAETLKILYHTYKWEEYSLPSELVEHIGKMAAEDDSEEVHQTALSILDVIGEITYDGQGQQQTT